MSYRRCQKPLACVVCRELHGGIWEDAHYIGAIAPPECSHTLLSAAVPECSGLTSHTDLSAPG